MHTAIQLMCADVACRKARVMKMSCGLCMQSIYGADAVQKTGAMLWKTGDVEVLQQTGGVDVLLKT